MGTVLDQSQPDWDPKSGSGIVGHFLCDLDLTHVEFFGQIWIEIPS